MKDVEIIKARNVLSSRARTNLAKRLRVAAYCRVSTDSEDQLNSYKSQVQHYTDLIKSKSEWDLAGIYADEAITGTQVTKREDFQRLINDCMNGDVDMIITKSISRFARNTLDTLKYVRMLKEKGIAVFFEEENINTLTMDGELLLVILSSVAQQEVENISANVKKGLKMKMQRGELVGFQGCLGYDYHPEDKSISINEEEAEIVRYIFRRYIEGAGGSVIAQELENLGYKTKRGSTRWAETTVIGIIKNEKYKGDILMGKTFTLDPISKRRLDNFGEEDQFYIRDHHEAIISEEMFEKAQEILKRRAKPRRLGTDGKREKFSRKYAFSCMLECGFCGGTLTRRSWHSGSQYNKVIWQCVTATKKGKKFCPDSKGIAEETIEQAFIESYRLLCQNNKDVLDEFIARTEETLSDSNASKQLAKVEKDIAALDAKRAKLVDMRLEEIIDKETYEQKYFDLSSQIEQLQKQRESLQESAETESTMKKRIAEFRRTLEENEVLDTFDRYVFESIVEKVIVGGYDEDGNKDPAMLTFIYKTGFKNSLDGTNFKPPRKNSKAAKQNAGLCSHTTDEAKSMCSYHSDDTIYGGSYNLLEHTLPQYGVETTFVDAHNLAEVEGAIKDNTRAIYLETLGNPNSDIPNIDAIAEIAHKHGLPLVVDNTFGAAYWVRPIEHGADIVVHSATKFFGGHGTTLGGIIVEAGTYDWKASGKYPAIADPNPSYHGISFADATAPAAFVTFIRAILLRDTGATISPFNAFLLLQGIETLPLRLDRHAENTKKVIEYLKSNPLVEKVNHPSLEDHPDHELYKKYFHNGGGSIFTFEIKGGKEAAYKFIDSLKIFSILANVADVKSLVIHPASTTHSQLNDEELADQGISQSTIRLSIGTEHIDDIIEDLDQAFKAV